MRKIIFIVIFSLLSITAESAQMTQNVSFDLSYSHIDNSSWSIDDTQGASFNLFDPSLGTLDSVEYRRIDASKYTRVYIRNTSDSSAHINLQWSTEGYLTREPSWDGPRAGFRGSGGTGTLVLDPYSDWRLVSGAGIDNDGPITQIVSGDEADSFIGDGIFDMSPRLTARINVSGISGGTEYRMDTNFWSNWDIVYNYTPIGVVPDPTCSISKVGVDPAYAVNICISNPGNAPVPAEIKVWAEIQEQRYRVLGIGADRSIVLPAGFHVCLDIMDTQFFPTGITWGIRLIDPITGETLCEDILTAP